MTVKAIVLGAGRGTRMNSDLPKVMHPICGTPMIRILLNTLKKTGVDDVVVVIGPDMESVEKEVSPFKTVIQRERLGTAHAVLAAKAYLTPFDGCFLILFGDSPLISGETLRKMISKCGEGIDVTVLGFLPADPRRYGRLVMGEDGLEAIVEYKDATDMQRAIRLCNSGVMCVNAKVLAGLLEKVKNENAAGEYYLTDIVSLARQEGLSCDVVIGDVDELHGINTPEELETAQEIFEKRRLSEKK